MHVYACLLLYFISMFACLNLGFAMLGALRGLVLTSFWGHLLVFGCIHPARGLFGCNHLREYIPVMLVCLLHALSPLRAMLCLPCLLYATHLAFFASLHFCMLAYMFRHEFVCRPYSNPMELWTSDPNLQLSILLSSFPSIYFFACLLPYFLCLCMYTDRRAHV